MITHNESYDWYRYKFLHSHKPDKCGNCTYCFHWPYSINPNCNHPIIEKEFQPVEPTNKPPNWCPYD